MLVLHLVRHRHRTMSAEPARWASPPYRGAATDNTVSDAHVPDGTEKPPAHHNHKQARRPLPPGNVMGGAWPFLPRATRPTPSHPTPTRTHAPLLPGTSHPPPLYRPFLAPLPCPHPIPEEHTAIPPSPLTPSLEMERPGLVSRAGEDDNYLAGPPWCGGEFILSPPNPHNGNP